VKAKFFSALIGLLILASFSPAWAIKFNYPKWNGYALDWCATFENNCGKPAADLYCQKKGYPQSTGFVKIDSVNYQTMTIGQNAICNPSVHRCDSFQSISCLENIKVFNQPKHNGYRLDWCRQFEQQCGQPAALTYCQKQGYSQVIGFQKQGPLTSSTMTIGSNAICNPQYHHCDSFSYIRCKK